MHFNFSPYYGYLTAIFILHLYPVILSAQKYNQSQFIQNASKAHQVGQYSPDIYLFLPQNMIIFDAKNHYSISYLNTLQLYSQIKSDHKNLFSFNGQYLKFESILRSSFQLGYQRKLLPNINAGMNISYQSYKIGPLQKTNQLNLDISFSVILSQNLIVGTKLKNILPFRSKNRYLPSTMQLNIHYAVNPSMLLWANIKKDIYRDIQTIIGFFFVVDKYHVNMFVNPSIGSISYTLGFQYDPHWNIKIGNEYHQQLGLSTESSIGYTF